MRDRLIELIRRCTCHYGPPCEGHCAECQNSDIYDEEIEHIADTLLANGVIVPPCKVGDTVYTIFERKIEALEIVCSSRTTKNPEDVYEHYDARNNFLIMPFSECHIGKTVFLTKEQAEQKLKEMRVENG